MIENIWMKSSGVSPLHDIFKNLKAGASVTKWLSMISEFSFIPTFWSTSYFKHESLITLSWRIPINLDL